MNTISREDLTARLAAGEPITLVMALGPHRHAQAHIPGSVTFDSVATALDQLDPDDDIVVYCSHHACNASRLATRLLTQAGFRHVRRYAGGLADWHAAGLPLASHTPTSEAVAA